MLGLIDFPNKGEAVPGRPKTHWIRSGSHRIVYRIFPGEVRVLRVLHVKQDFGRHLR